MLQNVWEEWEALPGLQNALLALGKPFPCLHLAQPAPCHLLPSHQNPAGEEGPAPPPRGRGCPIPINGGEGNTLVENDAKNHSAWMLDVFNANGSTSCMDRAVGKKKL